MTVYVLSVIDSKNVTQNLGVFSTLELAKETVVEEEPQLTLDWWEAFGLWIVTAISIDGSSCTYHVETFEVRDS